MNALTFRGKENIQYESIPDPEILEDRDVIVQVKACAICGSDLHPYHEREQGLDHGCAMGHEFTGEVVAKGKKVKFLKIGDEVISPFSTSCGECFYCKKGLTSRCEFSQLFGWREQGKGLHGAQAELVRVPLADYTLVRKPKSVSKELALLLGDILSTGYFCAEQAGIQEEEVQVVIGCGPVGLMSIWAAKKMGANHVYAIDAIPERLAMAAAWGAIPINFRQENPSEIIKEATQGRGADVALEAVGSAGATRSAYDLLRPGGILSAVGVNTAQNLSFNPVEAYNKNITYKIGRCPARAYIEKLMPIASADEALLSAVFTHRYDLAQGKEAYALFAGRQDNCIKVFLSV